MKTYKQLKEEIENEIERLKKENIYFEEEKFDFFSYPSLAKEYLKLTTKLQTLKQARQISIQEELEKTNGTKEIYNNHNLSFMGTFKDALKNGYKMNDHYVIVEWKFFHRLLSLEKERISQLQTELKSLEDGEE